MVLRNCRHPLLLAEEREGRLDRVVPLDLRLGDEFDLLVITGPNTGGKTIALKGAGLAALMTRLGLPLAADEGTAVPLYDGVVADIGDEQELRQSLSTFSSHLDRIRRGLERATERTLVLLDELGGGTDPDEGAALGDALLEELARRRIPTLASTHLGQLKHFAFRNARAENACVEFDVESLAPSHRLVIGAPGESRALAIARRIGLDEALVRRAEERLGEGDPEQRTLVRELVDARVDAERLRAEADERRAAVAREEAVLEDERAEVSRRGDLLEAEAERGLEDRVRAARAGLERARQLLGQVGGSARAALAGALDELESALAGAALGDRRRGFLDGLKKGDQVFLPRFGRRVTVTRIDRAGERLRVRLGKREMEVGMDEVTAFEEL
jgi:DNA mismatch repair protein MutS2